MEQPIAPQARAPPKLNKLNYACEACRSSKVKCQPGSQPGICKRCSEFKRECIFRTGPRTRRPKTSRLNAEVLPPPPGPSKTFTIDFTMPADDDPRDGFDDLRERHERYIEDLVPSGEQDDDEYDAAVLSPSIPGSQTFSFNDMSMPMPPSSTSSSPSRAASRGSAANSRPVSSLGIKPQFNLDSAAGLLASFREMLPHCPCVVLPDDADVRRMARDMPFILLAILAVVSCSTSLQGHSLYDEEFRKILGLKFVAGGERSLELLQGMLIYCAWYPFHLRPKNKQLAQFLGMAVDTIHDLELDKERSMDLAIESPEGKEAMLPEIRAYLACFYSSSIHSMGMSKPTTIRYTPWMAKCCDSLEACSNLEQDHILVWLVRMQYIQHELWEIYRTRKKTDGADYQNEQHRQLLRIGLESQLRDFQARIPGHLTITPSIFLTSLNTDAYVLAAPLMHIMGTRLEQGGGAPIDETRLQAAAYTVRAGLDFVGSLTSAQMGRLSGHDMTRIIVFDIIALRLSFPVPACPAYDYAHGRAVLDFGTHLAKMSAVDDDNDGGSSNRNDGDLGAAKQAGDERAGKKNTRTNKKVDAVTAMRVVLGSVKAKFDRKSAELEKAAAVEGSRRSRGRGCPMFDGSLDQYIPLWDGQQQQQTGGAALASSSYATSYSSHGGSSSSAPVTADSAFSAAAPGAAGSLYPPPKPVFHDLWATMTMGWATDEDAGAQQGAADMAALGGFGEYGDFTGL
ncbi:hypothetical protein GGR52DRAFT_545112 [Hypoxylon sp. FL1284]|nr:hypothetical protein GGR52DRAFT_545112 [Hypoxylon sp. FL1284]